MISTPAGARQRREVHSGRGEGRRDRRRAGAPDDLEDRRQAGSGRRGGRAGIYLVLPKLVAVLGAWPRLSTLNPIWFTVCVAAELISFTCNFALQRLALRTGAWFPVVTAGLTGNSVTNSLPGGDAAGAAVQFKMLTTAGFDTDTAVGGLTTFSLLEVGGLLALPIFALPAILAGVPASMGARPYRPARDRRVRPVCHLRRDRPGH
jgi:hypothetical protein